MSDPRFDCNCKPLTYTVSRTGILTIKDLSAPKVIKETLERTLGIETKSLGETLDAVTYQTLTIKLADSGFFDFFIPSNQIAEKRALTKALIGYQLDAKESRAIAKSEAEKPLSVILIDPTSSPGDNARCGFIKLIESLINTAE